MAAFLAWLFSVADKVYRWFGAEFAQLYAGAWNAWTWAVTQAAAAYNNAKSYAYNLFAALSADITGLSDWTAYWIDQLREQVGSAVGYTYSQIIGWIQQNVQTVLPLIQAARDYAAGLVSAAQASITAWVRQLVADATGAINAGFSWVLSLRSYLITLANSISLSALPNLSALAGVLYADIKAFFDNPVQWILDMLQLDLVEALCWLIAVGLGTVNDPLPLKPPWRR